MTQRLFFHLTFPIALLVFATAAPRVSLCAEPLVEVTFTNDAGKTESRSGRVLVEAVDGGVLLEDRAKKLWTVTGDKKQSVTRSDSEFLPYSADELGKQMLAEFGS